MSAEPALRPAAHDLWTQPHLTPAIAPESVAWDRVESATYRIDQRFFYEYPGPIANLRHRLVVSPPRRHGAQERLARRLSLAPHVPTERATDAFGNDVVTIDVPHVESSFDVTFASLVQTRALATTHYVAAVPLSLHQPAGLTACDDAMRETAYEMRRSYGDDEARARAISSYAYRRIAYTKDVTDVGTTAIQAFHFRRGVCQDLAHVALALGRAAGLACRYVSGHLLGEGGTHAWVEFLIPEESGAGRRTRVLALDPTHDRDVTMRYVVVAVGRDYEDVPPTSGAYDAPYCGTFTARHAVTIARVTYA